MTRKLRSVLVASVLCLSVSGCAATTSGAVNGGTAAAAQSLGIKETLVQVALQTARDYLGRVTGTAGSAAAAAPAGAPPADVPAGAAPAGTAPVGAVAATVEQKEEAARQGVGAAVAKAKEEGQALTPQQETGLVSVLKGLL